MNKFYYFHILFNYHSMSNNSIWDDTEQSLVILMQQGNQQAFGKLYDKYAPMLMGLIIRLVGDKKTAEDVLQQVFNKIWENKTVFDFSKERLFSKMIKIARDTAREVSRMGKTNFNGEIPEANKTVYINGIGNPLPEQNNTMGSALLFNMEKTSKEALDLIYFKGYNFTDAAAVLNIPLNSLKEKVKMAIKQLKVVAIS